MDTDKLVKTLIKQYLKEYEQAQKLYKKYKTKKLEPKKITELKEDIKTIKKKVNYLLEQMNEKIKATNEIQDYDKEIYEQYKNLASALEAIKEEIVNLDTELNGEENGGANTQA